MTRYNATGWLLFAGWLVATAASLGSLFFSEVMGVIPCVLCWYQRVAMYSLAFILAVALFPTDPRSVRYALPIAIVGALTALYHFLLLAGVIPAELQPCSQGVPCTDENATSSQSPYYRSSLLSLSLDA
jgi:disulfide bond formation protein DsbB